MEYLAAWIGGLVVFFLFVGALFLVLVRGTRAILGPRRRLEEEFALEVLRGRLARGEISNDEFRIASQVLGIVSRDVADKSERQGSG